MLYRTTLLLVSGCRTIPQSSAVGCASSIASALLPAVATHASSAAPSPYANKVAWAGLTIGARHTITSMSKEESTGSIASLEVDAREEELGKPNALDAEQGAGQMLHAYPPPAGFESRHQDYSLVLRQGYDLAAEGVRPVPRGDVGSLTGAPAETYQRKVAILAPANSPTQQGSGRSIYRGSSPSWKIEKDVKEKWINPLMGWTSTADALGDIDIAALWFYTKEQAIAFAEKHGWEYEVLAPNKRRFERQRRFAGYGDNFTVKRGGVPDLTHLDQLPKLSQAGLHGADTASKSSNQQQTRGGSGRRAA